MSTQYTHTYSPRIGYLYKTTVRGYFVTVRYIKYKSTNSFLCNLRHVDSPKEMYEQKENIGVFVVVDPITHILLYDSIWYEASPAGFGDCKAKRLSELMQEVINNNLKLYF